MLKYCDARQAMEACLAHLAGQRIDRIIYLGDRLGYGAHPHWVEDKVRDHIARSLAGALPGNYKEAMLSAKLSGINPVAIWELLSSTRQAKY